MGGAEQTAADGLHNLVHMSNLSEDALVEVLKERLLTHKLVYTRVHRLLIALNPLMALPGLYSEERMGVYNDDPEAAEPHAYEVGASCYRRMLEGADQAVIISGESGAGKTETFKKLISFLSWRAPTSKSGASFEQLLVKTVPALEAFGNASTALNHNSSRYGKLVSLYYTGSGELAGVLLKQYLLEKSRVCAAGERRRAARGVDGRMVDRLDQLRACAPTALPAPAALLRRGPSRRRAAWFCARARVRFARLLGVDSRARTGHVEMRDGKHTVWRAPDRSRRASIRLPCWTGRGSDRPGADLTTHLARALFAALTRARARRASAGLPCLKRSGRERTFHAFYELMTGADAQTRSTLRLDSLPNGTRYIHDLGAYNALWEGVKRTSDASVSASPRQRESMRDKSTVSIRRSSLRGDRASKSKAPLGAASGSGGGGGGGGGGEGVKGPSSRNGSGSRRSSMFGSLLSLIGGSPATGASAAATAGLKRVDSRDDRLEYVASRQAIRACGVRADDEEAVWQCVGALLHLGAVEFWPASRSGDRLPEMDLLAERTLVMPSAAIAVANAAALLGVDADALTATLTARKIKMGAEWVRRAARARLPRVSDCRLARAMRARACALTAFGARLPTRHCRAPPPSSPSPSRTGHLVQLAVGVVRDQRRARQAALHAHLRLALRGHQLDARRHGRDRRVCRRSGDGRRRVARRKQGRKDGQGEDDDRAARHVRLRVLRHQLPRAALHQLCERAAPVALHQNDV
jgi:hypothetical protein